MKFRNKFWVLIILIKIKKLLLSAVLFAASFTSIAQVGIGTEAPEGVLDVVSLSSGLIVPRVSSAAAVVNPNGGALANGTVIYDLSLNCFNFYENGAWTGCLGSGAAVANACGAFIAPGVFKEFMCHNLGADNNLDSDVLVQGIHGNYYQWGIASVAGTTSDSPAGISGWQTNTVANGAWNSGTETAPVKVVTNDPCPTGYRVPTDTEWAVVANTSNNTQIFTGTFIDSATNFGSGISFGPNTVTKTLTLPAAAAPALVS